VSVGQSQMHRTANVTVIFFSWTQLFLVLLQRNRRLRSHAAADEHSRLQGEDRRTQLISVSVGTNFGAGGLILSFVGVLAGTILIAVGARMADDPAPAAHVVPAVFASARALASILRRSRTVVGLVIASFAVTAVPGEAGPVLCLGMSTLLLLGLVGIVDLGQDLIGPKGPILIQY